MDLSEDWKSLFPISAVFRSPLLSGPSTRPILGPLVFNRTPNTITHLLSSPSLLPRFSPFPHLNLPRFLLTSSLYSSLLPSTSFGVAPLFRSQSYEEIWTGSQTAKPFFLHCPIALNCTPVDHAEGSSVYEEEVFGILISKVPEECASSDNAETVGPEFFDSLCPIQLRFDYDDGHGHGHGDDDASAKKELKFGPKELKAYKLLKKQFSKWQGDFNLYEEFCSRSKLRT